MLLDWENTDVYFNLTFSSCSRGKQCYEVKVLAKRFILRECKIYISLISLKKMDCLDFRKYCL